MPIVKMEKPYFSPCVDILYASELGRNYYPRREMLEQELERAAASDKIYVKAGG